MPRVMKDGSRPRDDWPQSLWEYARDSTPERLRQRFGDADYDWDYRVNTTSGAVGWRDRLLGMFHSAYQPTEPAAFHEMLDAVQQAPGPGQTTLNFRDSTFIDLGSGRTDAADGVGLSVSENRRRGTAAISA